MAPKAPGPAPARPAPRTAVRPEPQAAPRRPGHPHHRRGHGGLVTLLVVGLGVLGAGLWYLLGGASKPEPGEQLLAQMEAAAQGTVVPNHVFGGALTVSRDNGRVNVTAERVPSRACVQVGWRLAKEGTIIVNGTLPPRLSAARLSDLCSGDGATLLWVPDEE